MELRWWMKIPIKLVLSRLPISNAFFRKFSIFKHGFMDDPNYSFGVAQKHYLQTEKWLPENFVALELGPGDSQLSALNMHALGAEKIYMVDAGEFASKDMQVYSDAYEHLLKAEYDLSAIDPDANNVDQFYKQIDTEYLTNGLKSLQKISDDSIDLVWSHAVLEHVRHAEFEDTMKELYRVLKPGAISSHVIDLLDHLEESLNNLRVNTSIWESTFFSSSGFYTNRMRNDEIIDCIEKTGFTIISKQNKVWDSIPISKDKFVAPYNNYSDDNLKIHDIDIVLQKPL